MIVRRFLLWVRSAAPGDRAEAVGALARAFLHSELSDEDRWEAETALVAMLDDPSCLVRRTMAEILGPSAKAPRAVVIALASDAPDIAALVLGRSPLLDDADLVDAAALGDARMQCAIASRRPLGVGVSAALAEVAGVEAVLALAANPVAAITDASFARIVERHGVLGSVREALLDRPDLPVECAQAIASAVADELKRFVAACGWLTPERSDRVVRDARDRATVALSARSECDDVGRLVAHLRRSAQLTAALMLRACLSRQRAFAEAAFAELSGLPRKRVAAAMADRRGQAFRALYGRAGMPDALRPAFEAAVAAWRTVPQRDGEGGATLSREMTERVLSACSALPPDEAGRLLALLRRFDSEAVREEARRIAHGMGDDAALAIVRRYDPGFDLGNTLAA